MPDMETTHLTCRLVAAWMALGGLLGAQTTPDPPRSLCLDASPLAGGVELVRGRFVPGSQPDGNSVVLRAPGGLVVIDTGRHAEHTRTILECAGRAGVPIAAVINTHWHIDHIGGNPRVRRAFPEMKIFASGALAQAQAGFLADYRRQLVDAIAGSQDSAARSGWENELAIIDAGPALAPDEVIASGGLLTIAGRPLSIGLESRAVTAGDVWVLDPATGVLAAGDLVTLPVPLLDTACPLGWQTALDRLSDVEFDLLVPGHGSPMTRGQFEVYHAGFAALLGCAATDQPEAVCIDGWLRDLGPLVPPSDHDFARLLLQYYIPNILRASPEKTAAACGYIDPT
jgi:glyoxylase-like metal-dependent hydrolase (beta-lactamase superfamily II)